MQEFVYTLDESGWKFLLINIVAMSPWLHFRNLWKFYLGMLWISFYVWKMGSHKVLKVKFWGLLIAIAEFLTMLPLSWANLYQTTSIRDIILWPVSYCRNYKIYPFFCFLIPFIFSYYQNMTTSVFLFLLLFVCYCLLVTSFSKFIVFALLVSSCFFQSFPLFIYLFIYPQKIWANFL